MKFVRCIRFTSNCLENKICWFPFSRTKGRTSEKLVNLAWLYWKSNTIINLYVWTITLLQFPNYSITSRLLFPMINKLLLLRKITALSFTNNMWSWYGFLRKKIKGALGKYWLLFILCSFNQASSFRLVFKKRKKKELQTLTQMEHVSSHRQLTLLHIIGN